MLEGRFPLRLWRRTGALIVATVSLSACGGSSGAGTAAPRSTLSLDSDAPQVELAPMELAVALGHVCQVARQEIVDRSRPSASRLRRIEARFNRTPSEELLDEFFHRVEVHAELGGEQRFPPFASVRAVAASAGVPDYQCPEFERLLGLVRAGDLDLAQAPTPIQDLGRLCDVAVEALGWGPSTLSFGVRFSRRVTDELANAAVRRAFETVNSDDVEDRYSALRMSAREFGMPGWACPPLEAAFLRADSGARADARETP